MIRDTLLGLVAFGAIVVLSVVFFTATRAAIPAAPCELPLVEWPSCMMPR